MVAAIKLKVRRAEAEIRIAGRALAAAEAKLKRLRDSCKHECRRNGYRCVLCGTLKVARPSEAEQIERMRYAYVGLFLPRERQEFWRQEKRARLDAEWGRTR